MDTNKNHWYDGLFYDFVIAPNQDKLFAKIRDLIKADSSLLDIGCGTGRMAFNLADKCSFIKAIDLSEKNITLAKSRLSKNHSNIEFEHTNALMLNNSVKYDYAVLTYVLHEMNSAERIELLQSLFNVAKYVIIGEYLVPHPRNLYGFLDYIIEFLAGNDHFNNFKNFIANGGAEALALKSGFRIKQKIVNKSGTSCLLLLEK
ncbi:MAG: class I SAM-dependent methyltransferase [Melioribacteraceae bacterium]|nr:class I SAM-dependent methyltransferase [Melioribacteraceae bacterium]